MTRKPTTRSFRWTPETDALARLLAAIGTPNLRIARRLKCRVSTVRHRIGNVSDRPDYSLEDILRLYDAYDTARNVMEVISAEAGTAEQARLRASLRAARTRPMAGEKSEFEEPDEALSDEDIRADLERLVGRPIRIADDV